MIKRLKRIAPVQLGKMLAVIYGLGSLIFLPFFLLFAGIVSMFPKAQGGPQIIPAMLGAGIGFMLFLPVMYALMGFISGAIGAFIYNLVAKWIGGIELEVE